MPAQAACPAAGDWERFLLGRVPPAEAKVLENHLDQCAECLQTVESALSGDSLVEAVGAQAQRPPEAEQPILDALVARMLALDGAEDSEDLKELCAFLTPPEAPDELGRLGPYRIFKVIGVGGMGVVFEAEDVQLQRRVALKTLRPALAASGAARRRFLREARAAAAIKHDSIVSIHQVGEDRGVPFLAMQLLEGECLATRLKRAGRLSPAEVLRIGRQVAEGLAAAHQRGLIHRDIKPDNVWLEAGSDRVKILDFGLARAVDGDPHLTREGTIVGTPAYMAPEQARGHAVDARCDLFSLGCLLYQACTGELPFRGVDTIAQLLALTVEEPPPPHERNPEVPTALSALVMRLLAKDANARPDSASAVAALVSRVEAGDTIFPAARRSNRRGKWALVAAVLLGLLGAAALKSAPAVIRFVTDKGTLVVEVDDPALEVLLREQALTIRDRAKNRTVRLTVGKQQIPAGSWELVVTEGQNGLIFTPDGRVTLTRNGQATVRIRREPEPPAITVAAPGPQMVASYFNAGDAEGWYTLNHDMTGNATKPIQILQDMGNYYLQTVDNQDSNEWGWHAPPKFLGNHADKFGRHLNYRIWISQMDRPDLNKSTWNVRLDGGGIILFIDSRDWFDPVPGKWMTYRIPLDESGGWLRYLGNNWAAVASAEEIKKCLTHVTRLRIRGEFSGKKDIGRLDDVEFGAER